MNKSDVKRKLRFTLDAWIKTLSHPRMIAMEATIFTGWICDHLLPHAERVKVAHPWGAEDGTVGKEMGLN